MLEGQGARTHVILVLCESIRNAPEVSLVLPNFDDNGSLGFMVPPRMNASCFFMGNREAELKPTTFCSLLVFSVFPLLLTPH